MTAPDHTLAARLAHLLALADHPDQSPCDAIRYDTECGDAHRSGQLITPSDHTAAVQAAINAAVAEARAEIYAQIEAMPRREELLSGQRTQYVQLHEVLAWIGAKP